VRPIVTPRFIPTCTPQLLEACADVARRYGLPVQSHLSENRSEIALVRRLEPDSRGYGDAYRRYGLFGQTPTVMAHAVWSDADERRLIKEGDVMVAHCPASNFNLASGVAPVRTYLDEGIRVGLGSDISGGHDLSMFRMMVYAIQASKIHYQRSNHAMPFLSLSEAFWMATKSGGSFFGRVGSFEEGYDFDALVIDDGDLFSDEYTLLERLERFAGLFADACKNAEALRLDVDLTFLALFRTNLVAVSIICSDKPFAVPTSSCSSVVNFFNFFSCSLSFSVVAKKLCKLSVLFTVLNKHSGNEYRFCNRSL